MFKYSRPPRVIQLGLTLDDDLFFGSKWVRSIAESLDSMRFYVTVEVNSQYQCVVAEVKTSSGDAARVFHVEKR